MSTSLRLRSASVQPAVEPLPPRPRLHVPKTENIPLSEHVSLVSRLR